MYQGFRAFVSYIRLDKHYQKCGKVVEFYHISVEKGANNALKKALKGAKKYLGKR
jgi:hypothetical protein